MTDRLTGPVHVVGTGLLGTSIGLALTRSGVPVWLSDTSADHLRVAVALGAGTPVPADGRPELTVVAVPPDRIGEVAAPLLEAGLAVTDVGSVKAGPLDDILRTVPAGSAARYVGSHPMAGSERSGPMAASAALFDGRPWAIAPHAGADPAVESLVEALIDACGGTLVRLEPEVHDRAVARTSHLPHLLAALVAGQLDGTADDQLALSGQGVRDVTRVAGGDPALWTSIIRANRSAVEDLLTDAADRLDGLVTTLRSGDAEALTAFLDRGVRGVRAIPAKHGGPQQRLDSVFVAVPDQAGELARLFGDCGQIGVNVEDLHIDHDPGRPVGLVEVVVDAESADRLRAALEQRGWTTHR